jgi:hypothetical protein
MKVANLALDALHTLSGYILGYESGIHTFMSSILVNGSKYFNYLALDIKNKLHVHFLAFGNSLA